MEKKFIMTAFGEERPGIVADVTQLIYENNCNLDGKLLSVKFPRIHHQGDHEDLCLMYRNI